MEKKPYRKKIQQEVVTTKKSKNINKIVALGATATALAVTGVGANVQVADASEAPTLQLNASELIKLHAYEKELKITDENGTVLVVSADNNYALPSGKNIVTVLGKEVAVLDVDIDGKLIDFKGYGDKAFNILAKEDVVNGLIADGIIESDIELKINNKSAIITLGDKEYVSMSEMLLNPVTVEGNDDQMEAVVTPTKPMLTIHTEEIGLITQTEDGIKLPVFSKTPKNYASTDGLDTLLLDINSKNSLKDLTQIDVPSTKYVTIDRKFVVDSKSYGNIGEVVYNTDKSLWEYKENASINTTNLTTQVELDNTVLAVKSTGDSAEVLQYAVDYGENTPENVKINNIDFLKLATGVYPVSTNGVAVGVLTVTNAGEVTYNPMELDSIEGLVLKTDLPVVPEGATIEGLGDLITAFGQEYYDVDFGEFKVVSSTNVDLGVITFDVDGLKYKENAPEDKPNPEVKPNPEIKPELEGTPRSFEELKLTLVNSETKEVLDLSKAKLTFTHDNADVTSSVVGKHFIEGKDYVVTVELDGYKEVKYEFTFDKEIKDITKTLELEKKPKVELTGDVFNLGDVDIKTVNHLNYEEVKEVIKKDEKGSYTFKPNTIVEVTYADKGSEEVNTAYYKLVGEELVQFIATVSTDDLKQVAKTAGVTVDGLQVNLINPSTLGNIATKSKVYITDLTTATIKPQALGVTITDSTGKITERVAFNVTTTAKDGVVTATPTVTKGLKVLTGLGLDKAYFTKTTVASLDGKSTLAVLGDLDSVVVTEQSLNTLYSADITENGLGVVLFKLTGTVDAPVINKISEFNRDTFNKLVADKDGKKVDFSKFTMSGSFEHIATTETVNGKVYINEVLADGQVYKAKYSDEKGIVKYEVVAKYAKDAEGTYGFTIESVKEATTSSTYNVLNSVDLTPKTVVTNATADKLLLTAPLKADIKAEDVKITARVNDKSVTVKYDAKTNQLQLTGDALKLGVSKVEVTLAHGNVKDELTFSRVIMDSATLKNFTNNYLPKFDKDVVVTNDEYKLINDVLTMTKEPTEKEYILKREEITDAFKDNKDVQTKLLADLKAKYTSVESEKDKEKVKEHKMDLDKLVKLHGTKLPTSITKELVDTYYDMLYHYIDAELVKHDDDKATDEEKIVQEIVSFLSNIGSITDLTTKADGVYERLLEVVYNGTKFETELLNLQDATKLAIEISDKKEVTVENLKSAITKIKVEDKKVEKHLSAIMTAHLEAYLSATELKGLEKVKGIDSIVTINKNLEKVTSKAFKKVVEDLRDAYIKDKVITEDEIKKATSLLVLKSISVGDKTKYEVTVNDTSKTLNILAKVKASDENVVFNLNYADILALQETGVTQVVLKTTDNLEIKLDVKKLGLEALEKSLGGKDFVITVTFKKEVNGVSFNLVAKRGDKTESVKNFGSFTKLIVPTALLGVSKTDAEKSRVFRSTGNGNIAVLGKFGTNDTYELFTQYGGTFVVGAPIVQKAVTDIGYFYNAKGMQEFLERGILVIDQDDKFSPNREMNASELKRALVVAMADGEDVSIKDVLGTSIEEYLKSKSGKDTQSSTTVSRQDVAVVMEEVLKRYDSSILEKVTNDKGIVGSDGKKKISDPTYNDVNEISNYAKGSVAYMQHLEIMTGKENSIFDATSGITKSQFTKVFGLTLNKLNFLDNAQYYNGK